MKSTSDSLHRNSLIEDFLQSGVEPYPDAIYGDGFRCSVELKDGTPLPCVMIRRSSMLIDLAIRRFEQEKLGRGFFANTADPYREAVKTFVASGNCVNVYDVASVSPSRYAIPLSLLAQIHGETLMSWTGFVLEMKNGSTFSFGTSFLTAFFDLPEGYGFDDVAAVHKHSFVAADGTVTAIRGPDGGISTRYSAAKVYREKPYFDCFVD